MNSIIVILVVLVVVVSSTEETFNYTVQLPQENEYLPTNLYGVADDEKQTMRIDIRDIRGKVDGGVTFINFKTKVLLVSSYDWTSCYILPFLNLTYAEAKDMLKTPPIHDGKLKGFQCQKDAELIKDEDKLCTVAIVSVPSRKLSCEPSDPDDFKYLVSQLAGVFDDKGLATAMIITERDN